MAPKQNKEDLYINNFLRQQNRSRGSQGRGGMHLSPAAMARQAQAALHTTQAAAIDDATAPVEDGEAVNAPDESTSALPPSATAPTPTPPSSAGLAGPSSPLPSAPVAAPQAGSDSSSSSASENITVRHPARPAAQTTPSSGQALAAPSPSPATPPPPARAAAHPSLSPLPSPPRDPAGQTFEEILRELTGPSHPEAALFDDMQNFVAAEVDVTDVQNDIYTFTHNGQQFRMPRDRFMAFQAELLGARADLATDRREATGLEILPRLETREAARSTGRRATVEMLSGSGNLAPPEEGEEDAGQRSESDEEGQLPEKGMGDGQA